MLQTNPVTQQLIFEACWIHKSTKNDYFQVLSKSLYGVILLVWDGGI